MIGPVPRESCMSICIFGTYLPFYINKTSLWNIFFSADKNMNFYLFSHNDLHWPWLNMFILFYKEHAFVEIFLLLKNEDRKKNLHGLDNKIQYLKEKLLGLMKVPWFKWQTLWFKWKTPWLKWKTSVFKWKTTRLKW